MVARRKSKVRHPPFTNRQIIKKLEKAGVRPTAEKRVQKSQKFAGKSFVFTGGLRNVRAKKPANWATARRQNL
jgi:NAD-dependent DNA ligase